MTSEHSATPASPSPPRSRRSGTRPEAAPLLQGLDRLREFVHQRLDRLETMARERGPAEPADPSERERELRRRIAELEERQTRLVAEAKRREQQWQSGMEQLESDRRLLTEAWDRLERERIDGPVAAGPIAARPAAPGGSGNNNVNNAPPVPIFRPAVAAESNDVITHAILQQFQALRSDVRRSAGGRRPRR